MTFFAFLGSSLSRNMIGVGISCDQKSAANFAQSQWEKKRDKLLAQMRFFDKTVQDQYDTDTQHSERKDEQSKWEQRINDLRSQEKPTDTASTDWYHRRRQNMPLFYSPVMRFSVMRMFPTQAKIFGALLFAFIALQDGCEQSTKAPVSTERTTNAASSAGVKKVSDETTSLNLTANRNTVRPCEYFEICEELRGVTGLHSIWLTHSVTSIARFDRDKNCVVESPGPEDVAPDEAIVSDEWAGATSASFSNGEYRTPVRICQLGTFVFSSTLSYTKDGEEHDITCKSVRVDVVRFPPQTATQP